MSTKSKLLVILEENRGHFISGQKIAEITGVSRAAINKAVKGLRLSGYDIESKTNGGYRLNSSGERLSKDAIEAFVKVPCSIEVFDSIGSTNDYGKSISLSETPSVIIADRQTQGRGRMGKSFESPAGTGLYLSYCFKPNYEIEKALFITMAAAISACEAIEKATGISTEIKWVNDLYLNGLKVSGILTEGITGFETGRIEGIVTGIGINCFPGNFSESLDGIAGPLSKTPGSFSRNRLAAELINSFANRLTNPNPLEFLDDYRNRCFIIGKNVTIKTQGTERKVLVTGIGNDGSLCVKNEHNKIEQLISGEISLEKF